MEKLIRSLPFLIILVSLCSCFEEEPIFEEPEVITTNSEIHELLVPHFDRFEEEARSRGFDIDLSAHGINGTIEEISQEHVAGTCTYGTHLPGDVVIDLEFWNNSSTLIKEMVIFHELGHCYLKRDHKETAFSNGSCTSIMRSGTGDCFDNYNTRTRGSYIDELFFSE